MCGGFSSNPQKATVCQLSCILLCLRLEEKKNQDLISFSTISAMISESKGLVTKWHKGSPAVASLFT